VSNLIRLQYEPLDEDLSKSRFEEVANEAVRGYGEAYARAIIKMFEKWLRPGGGLPKKNPIGASGAASRNFKVESKSRRGVTTTYVVEGGSTPANRYIRKGIPPGVSVSLSRLKLWAARKGISLLSSAEYKQKYKSADQSAKWSYGKAVEVGGYQSKSAKGNVFDAKTYGRAEKGKKDIVNSALKAIQNALFLEGTNRPGANWYKYFPENADGFDYPRYLLVERRDVIIDLNSEYSDATATALVSWWNSSGKVRVFDYKLGGLRGGTRASSRGGLF